MFEITRAQIDEFYERGFFIIPNLFSAGEIQKMQDAFSRLEVMAQEIKVTQIYKGSYFVLGQRNSQTIINRIVWCGAAEPHLLEVAADPRLINPAAQIMGTLRVQQLINQAHFKLPGDGVAFPWHQDIQHRQKGENDWVDINGRGSYVQSLMVLDDMTLDNGPVMFIPKSNLKGRMDLGGDGYNTPTRAELIDEKSAVPALAPSGSVIFFGPYTVHGSFPNQSTRARRVFINGYAYPGANFRTYPGEGSGRFLDCASDLAV